MGRKLRQRCMDGTGVGIVLAHLRHNRRRTKESDATLGHNGLGGRVHFPYSVYCSTPNSVRKLTCIIFRPHRCHFYRGPRQREVTGRRGSPTPGSGIRVALVSGMHGGREYQWRDVEGA